MNPSPLSPGLPTLVPRIAILAAAMVSAWIEAPSAIAQNSPAGAETALLSQRIPVGEQTALVLRIFNGKPESLPDRIPVDGLDISRSNRVEQKFGFGTGGNSSEYQFYYFVNTTRAGEFTIPALRISVGGVELTTKPLNLTVYERDPSDPALDATRPYFANLSSPSATIYAGQMTPFSLDVYVRGARSINDMGPPSLRHDSIVIDFDRTYKLDALELDGITFTTAQRTGSFFGLTPGSYTLGPSEVQVAMIDESSPFGRMPGFFQSFVAKTLRSNPLEIEVKALPEAGRPPAFRGSVGNFSLAVTASPQTLNVGDPISLDFEVKGPGNFETLQAPHLDADQSSQWRTYEARKIIDPTEVSDGVEPGRATFTQIVMPQSEVAEIPAFELVFFNPETGAYQVERTDPIPITVNPDPRMASGAPAGVAIPNPANPNGEAPSAYLVEGAPTPQPAYQDIVHIRTTSPHWREVPMAVTASPLFWAGQLLPLLGLGTLLGFAVSRRLRNRKKRRQKEATISFASAMQGISSESDRAEYYRATEVALESWKTEAGASGEKKLSDPLQAALEALQSRCQWMVYGAAEDEQRRKPDPQEIAECQKILKALEKHLG